MEDEFRYVEFKGCTYMGVLINRDGVLKCRKTGKLSYPRGVNGVAYSHHPTFSRNRLPTEKLLKETFPE